MDAAAGTAAPIATLFENHQAFLRYLERRVGNLALAEDILQEAFAKVVARPEQAPTDEAIVPWFYRTLRNAAVNQFRRRGAADRAYEAEGHRSRRLRNKRVFRPTTQACVCSVRGKRSRSASSNRAERARSTDA